MKNINDYISETERLSSLDDYILEKFKISSKNISKQYNYHPKTNEELIQTIYRLINKRGYNADLNDIDVSKITDMESVFDDNDEVRNFNGDISEWDVSNVENMCCMFQHSKFTGDISNWDVSNVKNMWSMFYDSEFNGDINNWNVRNLEIDKYMFDKCPLEKNPPKWYKK